MFSKLISLRNFEMIRKSQLCATAFLLLFCAQASANQTFSWQDCVLLAEKNNNSLRAAIAQERSTYYQKSAAFSGFLPQLNASLSSNRSSNQSSNQEGRIINSNTTSVSVTQNLFSGFADQGRIEQAKAENLSAKANINIVKAQVSYDLKYAYESLSYAKETLALLDQIIKRREDNLRIIELRFKVGMENKGSLLLAQAYLEQARYDRLQSSNLIESARAQLCKAIGLNNCPQFDIANSVPINDAPTHDINFSSLVENTPNHLQAVAQKESAIAGITISESGFFPSLNLTASKGLNGTTMLPQNDNWAVGANISFPFFSGGRDYYGRKSAYSIKDAAMENLQTTDQQIFVNLKKSYNSYIESIAKLKVDSSFRDAATLRADIARNKYNNGLLTFENWDIIETDLISRQKSYLQSKLNRVASEASWEQAQGTGVFSN